MRETEIQPKSTTEAATWVSGCLAEANLAQTKPASAEKPDRCNTPALLGLPNATTLFGSWTFMTAATVGDEKKGQSGTDTKDEKKVESAPIPAAKKPEADAPKTFSDLLASVKQKNVTGMFSVAEATADPKLASTAVRSILWSVVMGEVPNAHQASNELAALARGDSAAAGAAMCQLAGHFSNDPIILNRRWANGDIVKLWKAGKIDGEPMVKALYGQGLLNADSAKKILSDLESHPAAKANLCQALLGTSRKGGDYYPGAPAEESAKLIFTIDLPKEIRAAALDYLLGTNSPTLDEILLPLQKQSSNPEMADKVREILLKRWSSEQPAPPGEQAKSPFMVGDTLRKVVADFSSAPWTESVEASKRYLTAAKAAQTSQRYLEMATNLSGIRLNELDPSQTIEAMKTAPNVVKDIYKEWCTKQQTADKALAELNEINKKRLERVARDLNLPVPDLVFAPGTKKTSLGQYMPGTGEIGISKVDGAERPSPGSLHVIAHELTHHEQDTLIIKHLADRLKLGKTPTTTENDDLAKLYLEKTGSYLKPEFAEKVMKVRDGQHLSDGAGIRAEALQRARLEHNTLEKQADAITQWRNWLDLPDKARGKGLRDLLGPDPSAWNHMAKATFNETPESLKPLLLKFEEQHGDRASQDKTAAEFVTIIKKEVDRMTESGFSNEALYETYRRNPIEIESWAVQNRAEILAYAEESARVNRILDKHREHLTFRKMIDEKAMRRALGSMTDQVLKADLSAFANDKERSDFFTEQVKSAMRDQLAVKTNAELPDCLQKLRIEIAQGKSTSNDAQAGSSPLHSGATIKISPDSLKNDLKGVVADTFLGASNLAIIDLLGKSGQEQITRAALQPLLEKMATAAKAVIIEREEAVRTEAQAATNIAGATDFKPGTTSPLEALAISWDGAHVTIGKERFHVLKDLANQRELKEKELAQAKKELQAAEEKDSKSRTIADNQALDKQHGIVNRLTQECKALVAIDEGLKGSHGTEAQVRARELVDAAVRRTVEAKQAEHRSPSKPGGGGGGRLSAGGLFLASLAQLYYESDGKKPGTRYGE